MRNFDLAPLYRATVGFDQIADMFDRVLSGDVTHPTYPPYNIEKTGETDYRISIAVAGFSEDELDVTVKENTLLVTGKGRETGAEDNRVFLHRGIAGRAFRQAFALADAVRVTGAHLNNGLLHIELERVVPEEAKPRSVKIGRGPTPKVIDEKAA